MFHYKFMTVILCLAYLLTHSNTPSISDHSLPSTSTATRQYACLNIVPLSFFLTCPRSSFAFTGFSSKFLIFLIILSGDIQLNPGPSTNTFNVCTLNIRSLFNPLHYTAVSDLADTHHIHLFALTETWASPLTTSAELFDATPHGFTLISTPRPVSSSCTSSVVGGGTAFLIRDPFTLLPTPNLTFKSFELSTVTLKLPHAKLTVFNIYRPPPTAAKSRSPVPFSQFLKDLHKLFSISATTPHEFLITGDFNLHLDNSSDSQVKQFLSALDSANLKQHIDFPTHRDLHILDLLITRSDTSLSPNITSSSVSPSDHFPIFSRLHISPPNLPPLATISIRSLKSINLHKFTRDILSSRLLTHPPSDLASLVNLYNFTLSSILNKHAPLKTKTVRPKQSQPWFNSSLSKLKSARRHLEKIWLRTRSAHDWKLLRSATNHYHAAIISAKRHFNSTLIYSNLSQPRKLWHSVNKLLHRKSDAHLPTSVQPDSLPVRFASYFSDKIHKLHISLLTKPDRVSPHSQPTYSPKQLTTFEPVTCEEISKLISESSDTYCELDPIPTSLLKQCSSALLPTITNIINLSLSTGVFPDLFKSSLVLPHLKKHNLDSEELGNYRPISHLSFLSKLAERVVKSRLTFHLSSNSLFNTSQSAYTKFHSTESTLLAVHNNIINAMSQQKLTALCLLDLSSAFDTIDHTVLIQRLSSWFGLNGTVLSWLKSYLSHRSFKVSVNGSLSSVYQLFYGVPQGSVLGPLLFTLYTTPLSSLISQSSVNHHLYADDTQLYISFSALNFQVNILHLQETISKISDWMSSNFLSLNATKTEFLLIGLSKQLSKISDPVLNLSSNVCLSAVSSARNLGVIFDNTLSMSQHISAVSRSCLSTIRDLRRIRNNLDFITAKTIATSLIHSKLDYCNSLFLNLPLTELNRLQLVLNSAARTVTKTPKYHHISHVLKSLHWLKIPQRIHYKLLSITFKTLQSHQPSYLYSLISLNSNKCTRSSAVLTLSRPTVTSHLAVTNRSFLHQAPILWNALPYDMRQLSTTASIYTRSNSPSLALSSSLFHSRLKTHLFHHSFPP
jgi:hypothetical protein